MPDTLHMFTVSVAVLASVVFIHNFLSCRKQVCTPAWACENKTNLSGTPPTEPRHLPLSSGHACSPCLAHTHTSLFVSPCMFGDVSDLPVQLRICFMSSLFLI